MEYFDVLLIRAYLDDVVIILKKYRRTSTEAGCRPVRSREKVVIVNFLKEEVKLLGYIISADGIAVDPDKTETICAASVHESDTTLCSFWGFTGYYRRFFKTLQVFQWTYALLLLKTPGLDGCWD